MSDNAALPVIDGHNDVLLRVYRGGEEAVRQFFAGRPDGHIDMPRAREGHFGGGFFAIFVPNSLTEPMALPPAGTLPPSTELGYSQKVTFGMAALLLRLERESDGQLKVVHTAAEMSECLQNGVVGAIMHIEGAEGIDPNFDALEVLHAAGLRSIGPVWSRRNIFAEGVPFKCESPDTGPGLTDLGREFVRVCNELRILIDLSHLNEKGFWDVARLSNAPLVATHSNAHSVCQTSRNLTDKQLDAIRDSGGMAGVNFGRSFLGEDRDAANSVEAIVRHVDYLVERMGIDHVGFGSDFDGTIVPDDVHDVAGLPRLVGALSEAGYDEAALRKLTHENWVRVLRETWGE